MCYNKRNTTPLTPRNLQNIVAYYLKARHVESQQRNGVFCAVRGDGCARNNWIRHSTAKQQLHCNRGPVFSARSMSKCYKQDQLAVEPVSRRRRRKGESQIWDSKIWSRVPRDSDPRNITLARTSSIYKRQTRSLVREGAPETKAVTVKE
jgi:hypothetical protein